MNLKDGSAWGNMRERQKPKTSTAGQLHPSDKQPSWLAGQWSNLTWKQRLTGGLGLVAFIVGLANPNLAIGLAVVMGIAAYSNREKKPLMVTLTGIAIACGVTGAIGLKIQGHYEEKEAAEQRKEAKIAQQAQQARDEAVAAKEKARRILVLDSAGALAEAMIAKSQPQLQGASWTEAQATWDAIASELSIDIALATEQKREDVAATLQAIAVDGNKGFLEGRRAALLRQIAEGDRLYAAEQYEGAREQFYGAATQLKNVEADTSLPSEFHEWARLKTPEVQALLEKAVRAKEIPAAIEYFKQWGKKKKKFKIAIRDMGSQEAHQAILIDLSLALYYVQTLGGMTPSENHLAPGKYRSKSFVKARERELRKLEKSAAKEFEYVVTCGARPQHSLVGGGNIEAKLLVKSSAHDPGSIDVENCSSPELTMRECWKFQCNVRGKNVFGAKVLNRKTFFQNASTIRAR